MSAEPANRSFARARIASREPVDGPRATVELPVRAEQHAGDERLEFVRFCYRRRRVAWPSLYDEMAAVAARGAFRGLGFTELAERGVCFSLPDLPRLAALTEQVMAEESSSPEPHCRPAEPAIEAVDGRREPRAEQQRPRFSMVLARN